MKLVPATAEFGTIDPPLAQVSLLARETFLQRRRAVGECGKDVRGSDLLVNGAGGVEVPVVVEPESPGAWLPRAGRCAATAAGSKSMG